MKKTTQSPLAIAVIVIAFSACTHKAVPNTPVGVSSAPVEIGIGTSENNAFAEGERIYTASCGRCHRLKNPASYTAVQWVPILDDMARKAKLSAAEKTNVAAYLNKNARAVN